jgi:hypothetical protein
LSTTFEEIVSKIVESHKVVGCRCTPMRRLAGMQRVEVVLELPSEVVDLFHNGAAGYRAQFYQGVVMGECANRRVIDALLPSILARPWEPSPEHIKASLGDPDAKVWICEIGGWMDDVDSKACGLTVERWEENVGKGKKHRFELRHMRLTPEHVTKLDIKGGCLNESFEPAGVVVKPHRSQELCDHGFT